MRVRVSARVRVRARARAISEGFAAARAIEDGQLRIASASERIRLATPTIRDNPNQVGHQKGHAPVPKKKLVRHLAVRGPTVIMDEYNTSKMCPCGTSELKNVHESQRLRCHKTVGPDGPCCVECSLGAENMDRDVLAIINFLLCARCALDGKERPDHLRGPWRFQ